MTPYRSSKNNSSHHFKPCPPELRRVLASTVFDCVLDRLTEEESLIRISREAQSDSEFTKAIDRYYRCAGYKKVGQL